jgi:hypothetical protein
VSDTSDNGANAQADISFLDKLKNREGVIPPSGGPTIDPGPRRRGRPPGSKNRSTATPEADAERAAEAKLKKRKELEDKYQKQILEEFNDQIMGLLNSQGVPLHMLYREGKAPIRDNQEVYAEIGARVAVSPPMAKAIAGFAADLQMNTKPGNAVGKYVQGTESNLLTLIVRGSFALALTGSYLKGVMHTYEELKPMMDARRDYEWRMNEKRMNAQEGVRQNG